MLKLLKTWFSIAFLMGKPWELPDDQRSLVTAVIAAVATYVLVVSMDYGIGLALQYALFDIAVAGSCLFAGLKVVEKPHRFVQAFSSYCGSSAILNSASLLMLNSVDGGQSVEPGEGGSAAGSIGVPQIVEFVYLVWGISVVAHIVRFTFETRLATSILLSTGYLFLYVFLMGALIVN